MKLIYIFIVLVNITLLHAMKDNLDDLVVLWDKYGIMHNKKECEQVQEVQSDYETFLGKYTYTQEELYKHINEPAWTFRQSASNKEIDWINKIEENIEMLLKRHYYCFKPSDKEDQYTKKLHFSILEKLLLAQRLKKETSVEKQKEQSSPPKGQTPSISFPSNVQGGFGLHSCTIK